MALARTVDDRIELLDLLRSLARRQSPDFLEQFIELLRAVLGLRFALIAEFPLGKPNLRTVAMSLRGRRIASFEQTHAGSAALALTQAGRLFVTASVRQRYPHGALLEDLDFSPRRS